MRSQSEIDTILADVRARLDNKARLTGVQLEVPKDGYACDDDWINVIVTPRVAGLRAFQYVDTLSDVERELRDAGVDHVLLVPALAD